MVSRAEAVIASNWCGIPIRIDGDCVYIRAMDVVGSDDAARYLEDYKENWEFNHHAQIWVLRSQKDLDKKRYNDWYGS